MPIAFTTEPDLKLGIARFSGEVNPEDLRLYAQAWAKPELMAYDELIFIEDDASTSFTDILVQGDEVNSLLGMFEPGVRTAIVENPAKSVTFASFWVSTLELNGVSREVQIFQTEAAARVWLNKLPA